MKLAGLWLRFALVHAERLYCLGDSPRAWGNADTLILEVRIDVSEWFILLRCQIARRGCWRAKCVQYRWQPPEQPNFVPLQV